MAEVMINVKDLSKNYAGTTVVSDLTFKVKKGEVIGFLGPNGAGKTTTMRMLTGYTPPSAGLVEVAGFNVLDDPTEVKRRIGYLPEHVPLYTDMTVVGYLKYIAEVKGVSGTELITQVDEAIDACALGNVAQKVITTISRGYRQRVGLAQALLGDPEVLILDEPTVGLDPKQILEIRNLIKEIGKERTVILSTHILPEVEQVCDRVIIVNQGKLAATGTTKELESMIKSEEILEVVIEGGDFNVFPKELKTSIKDISAVQVISKDKESIKVAIECKQDIRRELIKFLVKHKEYELLEIRRKDVDLEDIFLHLTK